MGIYYTLHCEVKINDKWENWDLYTRQPAGEYRIIPLLEGKSFVGSALNWYDLLSQNLNRSEVAEKTLEAHPTEYPEHQDWRVFDYNAFFDGKNFSVPECCGYMSRSIMNQYRTEKNSEILNSAVGTSAFLSPGEYAKLTPQAQRGFEWCEFTTEFGIHDVMRRIQQGVKIRLYAAEIDGPVRIVILVS